MADWDARQIRTPLAEAFRPLRIGCAASQKPYFVSRAIGVAFQYRIFLCHSPSLASHCRVLWVTSLPLYSTTRSLYPTGLGSCVTCRALRLTGGALRVTAVSCVPRALTRVSLAAPCVPRVSLCGSRTTLASHGRQPAFHLPPDAASELGPVFHRPRARSAAGAGRRASGVCRGRDLSGLRTKVRSCISIRRCCRLTRSPRKSHRRCDNCHGSTIYSSQGSQRSNCTKSTAKRW
jgi:hypothetical protein